PYAGCEVGAVAAARPLLLRPVELDVVTSFGRTRAEEAHEGVDHHLPPLRRGYAREAPGLVALQEAQQHAGRAVGRRVVECHLHPGPVAGGLAAEAGVAPERRVVEGVTLDHRA